MITFEWTSARKVDFDAKLHKKKKWLDHACGFKSTRWRLPFRLETILLRQQSHSQ
jgi:hypothetical protein